MFVLPCSVINDKTRWVAITTTAALRKRLLFIVLMSDFI